MIEKFTLLLYRYDLKEPPQTWDNNFLSCEYLTKEFGHKNKANLFFFTDSLDIAKDLGKSAALKNSKSAFFLTTTIRTTTLNLIDFSNRCNIFQMLCLLKDLNINVLTNDFKTFENENSFGQLKSFFDTAEVETDSLKRFKAINNLKVYSKSDYNDISLFGQRLTDFENGLKFKEIVQASSPSIDGYRWREFSDNRGFSYCLFGNDKLPEKATQKIMLERQGAAVIAKKWAVSLNLNIKKIWQSWFR